MRHAPHLSGLGSLTVLSIVGCLVATAMAQPPEPPPGRPLPPRERGPGAPPPPPREGEGFRPPPGPDPERFVERAMTFDADGDGKLDRAELGKFAREMMGRMRPRDPERFRREPPPRPERGDGDAGRERPERPRRPEGDAGPERPRRPFGDDERPQDSSDGQRDEA